MRKQTILMAMAFALIQHVYAQITVDYIGGGVPNGSRNIIDPASVAVPNGNQVRIGYFLGGFDVSVNAGNLTALQSNWRQYDFTQTTTQDGVSGVFSDSHTLTDSQFNGKKIYLWAFKTGDNAAPNETFGNVQSYGVYSSSDTSWVFPNHDAVAPNNTASIDANQINQNFWGSTTSGSLQLAAVPEPVETALALGLFCGTLAMIRRARRSCTLNS